MRRNSGLYLPRERSARCALTAACVAARLCVAASLAFALAACASSAPRQPGLDAAFARIQLAEARIEHARSDVARADNGCASRSAAHARAQQAEQELCAIAREIADADALLRCEQAQRSTVSIGEQARRSCAQPDATHSAQRSQIGTEAE